MLGLFDSDGGANLVEAVLLRVLDRFELQRQRNAAPTIFGMNRGDALQQPAWIVVIAVQIAHTDIAHAVAHNEKGIGQRIGQAKRLLGQPRRRWRGVRVEGIGTSPATAL